MSEEADLDDLLEGLGLDAKPLDANERLYSELASGKYTKLDNMVYWLKAEISKMLHMQEHHVYCTKNSVATGGNPIVKRLSRLEYSRLMIKYYLQMYHLPHFRKVNDREPCDYKIMVDKIVTYPPIADAIENYGG
jgi:hypothetical protein